MSLLEKHKNMALENCCKVMAKQIEAKWGKTWVLLGEDLRRAIIAEQVLHMLAARDEASKITPSLVYDYFRAAKNFWGIDTDILTD